MRSTAGSSVNRRGFLGALALPATRSLASQRSTRPNILLIFADDLGYGDLSSYGSTDLHTPNIDAMIHGGVRFDNFYANSPVCSPTRAALLSGRYPDRAGVPGVIRSNAAETWGYLDPAATLLPRALKPAGYHSALVGKWHLGLGPPNIPNEHGFDFFHGFLADMMDDYYHHRRRGKNYMRRDKETVDPQGHATDVFTGWAIDYLNSRKGETGPFFLYLAYNAPHVPVQPPHEWLARVRSRHPGTGEKRAKLAAVVEHLDAAIGRVIAALKANGQYENTLIVFTSDNGGELDAGGSCGALRGNKGDMYEGGIRVPMGAAWPGYIKPGSSVSTVALTMDLYPTLCDAAGVQSPSGIDGVSILPVMRHTGQLPERDLIWVRREGGMRYQGRDYYALRRGDWKLLQNTPFEPYRLHNLREDPLERKDLAAQNDKVYRDLTASLMRHIQKAGRTAWQPPNAG